MPKKFVRCVKKVSRETKKRYGYLKYNPYAVCRVATHYYGTTHDVGMLHPKCEHCKHRHHCEHCKGRVREMNPFGVNVVKRWK